VNSRHQSGTNTKEHEKNPRNRRREGRRRTLSVGWGGRGSASWGMCRCKSATAPPSRTSGSWTEPTASVNDTTSTAIRPDQEIQYTSSRTGEEGFSGVTMGPGDEYEADAEEGAERKNGGGLTRLRRRSAEAARHRKDRRKSGCRLRIPFCESALGVLDPTARIAPLRWHSSTCFLGLLAFVFFIIIYTFFWKRFLN
jgi:hypothetical protein